VNGPERRRSTISVAAGTLILAVTALFVVIGVDLALDAFVRSRLDRETYLNAIGFGLNREATENFLVITSFVILALCVLTTVQGIGVLGRREGVRHAAIGTFFVFAAVTLALSIAELMSDDVEPSVAVALVIGVVDASIVYLLLHERTTAEFELAERERDRARSVRAAARAARRASKTR
jgi:uncharacterized membrane protein